MVKPDKCPFRIFWGWRQGQQWCPGLLAIPWGLEVLVGRAETCVGPALCVCFVGRQNPMLRATSSSALIMYVAGCDLYQQRGGFVCSAGLAATLSNS